MKFKNRYINVLIRKVVVVSLCFSLSQIYAQTPLGDLQLHLTSDEGLSDHYFKKIAEDRNGFIWILSSSGISRFDGANIYNIKSPVLLGGNYTDMVLDTVLHNLWVGSTYGIYKIDLSTYKVSSFYPEKGNPNTLPHQIINSLYIDRNRQLWICTQFGLAFIQLETNKIKQVQINLIEEKEYDGDYNLIYSIIQDKDNRNIYWLSTNWGFLKFDFKQNKWTHLSPNLKKLKSNDQYTQLYLEETQNKIYGVLFSNPGFNKPFDYVIFDPMSEQYIKGIKVSDNWIGRTVFQKSENSLWLSSLDGVAVYDLSEQKVTTIHRNSDHNELSLGIDFIDSKNRIWSGNEDGIFTYCEKFTESEDFYYETNLPKSYHVPTSLYVDEDAQIIYLTVFGSDGIYTFNVRGQEWKIYKPHLNLGRDTDIFAGITVQKDDKGRIIVFDEEELYRLENNDEFKVIPLAIPPKQIGYITKAMMASDGTIWLVSKIGLYQFDIKANSYNDYSDKLTNCSDVKSKVSMFEDSKGNIWVSGHCFGFNVYYKEKNRFYSSNEILQDTSFQFSLYKDIMEHKGIVYLLSSGLKVVGMDPLRIDNGPVYFKNIDEAVFRDQTVSITHGHTEMFERVECGAFDKEGNLWMVSPTGFLKFNMVDQIEIYNENDNLIMECREMKIFVAGLLSPLEDGRFVYSTRKGIHLFNPGLIGVEETLPVPYIQQFYVNNQAIEGDTMPINRHKYILKPGQHFLSIAYSSIDYFNHDKTIYAYKLDGIDEDWVETRGRNFASYTNLKGGNYHFSLKARNPGGPWNENVLSLDIKIKKYWWNTLLAKMGFIFLLVGAVYWIYRQRIDRAVEKQRLLNEHEKKLAEVKMNALTAQMNPHFIFNSLNSIDYFILKNNTEKASDYLNRFSRLIRLILNHSRSNYVPLKDDLDALKLYIEIESLRFSNKFDYVVRANKNLDLENIMIPPMIFQPYVENAIWHGLMQKESKGKIEIELTLNKAEDMLITTITDNGIGRKKAAEINSKSLNKKKKKSMGMQIIQDKLEVMNYLSEMKATVEIKDLEDEKGNSLGTQVLLKIPL